MSDEDWLHRVVYMRSAAECTDVAHMFGFVVDVNNGVCKVVSLTEPRTYTVMSTASLEPARITGATADYFYYRGQVSCTVDMP